MANILDAHFKKTERADQGEISFDPNTLRLLLAVDESKTIREVAKEVKMSTEVFKASLIRLIKLKLIEQVEDPSDLLDPALMVELKETLVQLMGPMGELLIEDAAEELSVAPDRIPSAATERFINAVAKRIPGQKQQALFKTAMKA